MNRVTLVGNLTRDPELRRTQSGTAVLNIGLAVNNRRKNSQTGEWEDDPCYVDCVLFGMRAESLAKYLHKGSKVGIDGKLRYSSWEKDGGRKSKIDVIVDDLEMLTPKNHGGGQGGYQQPQAQTPRVQQPEPFYYGTSDVPF